VEATLSAGAGTPDLGGRLTTREMGDLIVRRLEES
jgi:isocitrate/isopropylmalate dehydrogenase